MYTKRNMSKYELFLNQVPEARHLCSLRAMPGTHEYINKDMYVYIYIYTVFIYQYLYM